MTDNERLLTNNQMAKSFGGYDFRTADMKKVCQEQANLTARIKDEYYQKRIKELFEELKKPCPHDTERYLRKKRHECPLCLDQLQKEFTSSKE